MTPVTPEDIIQKSLEIISIIRKQELQKHVTNVFCCQLETLNFLLINNMWVKTQNPKINIPAIFEKVLGIINNIKKKLGDLLKNKLFFEIGNNTPSMPVIKDLIAEFESIPKAFYETSLYNKFIEEEFEFKNLIQQLEFIDELAGKLIEKHKDYKKLIKATISFKPGELAIIFDLSYMPFDECTVSWMLFSMRLTSFIYDLDKIELKPYHLSQIRNVVDVSKVSAISFDTLNHFFNYVWIKHSERKAILSVQEIKTLLPQHLITSDEYPILNLKYNDQIIKIHPRGYDHPSNPNYRGDGITYFGRKTFLNPAQNDFYLENDLTISRKQFQIVYQEERKKYVILCISNSNPTLIRITDTKIQLRENSLFQLCENKIFKVEKIHFGLSKKQNYYLKDTKEKIIEEKENQIDNVKKRMELKFDLLAESTFLSVLELDPPDIDKTEKATSFKTVTLKFDPNLTSLVQKNIHKSQPIVIKKESKNEKKDTTTFMEVSCIRGYEPFNQKLIVKNPDYSQLFLLGRKNNNDIVMESQDMSLYHCQIVYDADKEAWYLGEKLSKLQEKFSYNGTFYFCKDFQEYNDKRPSKALELEEGMIIKVGEHEMEVHFDEN